MALFKPKTQHVLAHAGKKFNIDVQTTGNTSKIKVSYRGKTVGLLTTQNKRKFVQLASLRFVKAAKALRAPVLEYLAKLDQARGLTLTVNINHLFKPGLAEAKRRALFVLYTQLFQKAGFVFTGTNSMAYQGEAQSYDYSPLELPLKKVQYEHINQPKHYWQAMTPEQLDHFREMCFSYFRRTGFPYPADDLHSRREGLRCLMQTDINLIDGDDVQQNLTGLSLAWSFHKHAWGVPCGKNFITVLDAFNDDAKLMQLINKLIDYYPAMSRSNLFGRIKMLSGVQAVSNFRPTAAAALYEYFGGGVIHDMSGGWGGRMLGAYRAPNVRRYTATEPSSLTHAGLCEQAKFLTSQRLFNRKSFEVFKMGSEDYRPDKATLDFAFTSPPYFDCERYANEPTQSFVKFPTYNAWADCFLRGTFENIHHGLKPKRYMAINIANVRGAGDIEADTVRIAKECGFNHERTMYLLLSKAGAGYKREPIFVFRKKK